MEKDENIKKDFVKKFKSSLLLQTLAPILVAITIAIFEKHYSVLWINNILDNYLYGNLMPEISENLRLSFKISWYLSIIILIINSVRLIYYLSNIDFEKLIPYFFNEKIYENSLIMDLCILISFFSIFIIGSYVLVIKVYTTMSNSSLSLSKGLADIFYQNTFNSILFLTAVNYSILYGVILCLVILHVVKNKICKK